jgi:hypothetical protein
MFDQLNATEAIVLAILLAPTDAALGEAVVTEPRLPSRIRQIEVLKLCGALGVDACELGTPILAEELANYVTK